MIDQAELLKRVRTAFDFAGAQLRQLIETYPDYFPTYTVGGKAGQVKAFKRR